MFNRIAIVLCLTNSKCVIFSISLIGLINVYTTRDCPTIPRHPIWTKSHIAQLETQRLQNHGASRIPGNGKTTCFLLKTLIAEGLSQKHTTGKN